jgi:hypothetical protein
MQNWTVLSLYGSSRVEQQISDLNKKSEKIKTEVVTIQNVIASQQQSQAAAA